MNSTASKRETISLILPTLNFGGVERVFMTLANGLYEEGYDIDFVTLRTFADKSFSEQLQEGVRLVLLDASRVRKSFLRLASYFRQNHPAVVITGQVNSAVLLAARYAGNKARIVFTEHSIFSMEKKKLGPLLSRAYMSAARFFYPKADAVVAVSQGVLKDLTDNGICPPGRTRCIYNPVDIERIQRLSEEQVDHSWFHENRAIFLAVGRMESEKNYAMLLDAFARLTSERPDARLVFLGDGVLRSELEQRAKMLDMDDKVVFLGFRQNPFPYMTRANAVVLSSNYEGLPYALIEALACGASVVSTDCPSGPREVLVDGKYGLLSPVGDPEALCAHMSAVLEEPFPSNRQKRRAEDFSVKKIIAEYVDLIESLLRGQSPHPDDIV